MSKNKSKRKMTIKQEPVEEDTPSAAADRTMEVDGDSDLWQALDNASGLKLIRRVVEHSKELCKLLGGKSSESKELGAENVKQLLGNLKTRVKKVCDKHKKDVDKAEKFLRKGCGDENSDLFRLSCESEMFRTFLKYGMNAAEDSKGGQELIGILEGIYSVGAFAGKVDNPTLGIQMIVSHSSAPDIFLESHQFLPKSGNNKKGGNSAVKKPIIKPDPDADEQEKPEEEKPAVEKYSETKTELLKLWRNLVVAFTKISKTTGTSDDKKILENSVPYLLQMYSATMAEADREIFQILQEYTGKRLQIQIETMPLFGPKSLEPAIQKANPKASNPLFIHSNRANTVLGFINERQAYQTAMEYNENCEEEGICNKDHYDCRFLLPLLCHALDSKNICDAVKVISNGWIYLIVRGLSFDDPVMRNTAFLAYKLLIQNFQLPKKGFKVQDIKVWLHFLLSVRKGLQNLGRCKVSNLLSTWMVATWECIRQPAHPLYQRLTTLLFAKPVIDLGVLPDFMPFYNAADGNKATREWIMNILAHGLHTREDWQVAQRLPTINSLCCSFLLEKVSVQREILMILCRGARIPEVALEMVDKHALLLWIANVPVNINKLYGKELQELYRTLKENCAQAGNRQMLFQFVTKRHGWATTEETEEMDTSP